VVLTIKGTSAPIIDGGPTVEKDKLNDNLLFSCCCARVSRTWTPVCDCYRGGWKCDGACVSDALIEESLFYPTGVVRPSPSAYVRPWRLTKPSGKQNLYNNITSMYPDANIWVIGHSLGGALASLLGITFGVPVVTFEPPGERMAAQRLHLPTPVRHSLEFVYAHSHYFSCSPQRTILHTCGTRQTRSRWALAQAHFRLAE
jgi:putative lipase involved disintegration of autophagic bodies